MAASWRSQLYIHDAAALIPNDKVVTKPTSARRARVGNEWHQWDGSEGSRIARSTLAAGLPSRQLRKFWSGFPSRNLNGVFSMTWAC